MLAESYENGVNRVVLALGYTDLRLGIDGLARVVSQNFQLDPFEPGVLFLFCGRRADRIKGLLGRNGVPSPVQTARRWIILLAEDCAGGQGAYT